MSTDVSNAQEGSGIGNAIAIGLICLVIGASVGYYTRYFMEPSGGASSAPGSGAPPPGGGMAAMMGGMGGGGRGGGGGGMGGGGMSQPGPSLARLVRNLDTIQKAQNAGITPAQAQTLVPILEQIKSAETLPEAEAKAKLDALNNALTPPQKEALEAMQPFRGGGGGRGGGGPMGGPGGPAGGGRPGGVGGPTAGGPMASPGGMGMGGMGGGGMGGGQDPDKPFASERSKKALDDLISGLK